MIIITKRRLRLWKGSKLLLSVPCVMGRGGITLFKREGDMKTPAGVFRAKSAFGTAEKPETALPYRRIDKYTVMVDDPRSESYNRIIEMDEAADTVYSAEKMSEYPLEYKYGIVLSFNSRCRPGRGSGIFIHCIGSKPYTAGCAAVSDGNILYILNNIRLNETVVII